MIKRPARQVYNTVLEEKLVDLMDNREYREFFSRAALSMAFRAGYTAASGIAFDFLVGPAPRHDAH